MDTDEVYVFVGYDTTEQQLLSSVTDYTVDQFGNFTPITLAAAGTTVDVFFEEEFPGLPVLDRPDQLVASADDGHGPAIPG